MLIIVEPHGLFGSNFAKSQSYQASIQCRAIIGTPVKLNLNGVSLMARWRADDGPLNGVSLEGR